MYITNRSSCCNIRVRLKDLLGKQLFYIGDKEHAPFPVVRWVCPKCEQVYGVYMERQYNFWGKYLPQAYNERIEISEEVEIPNYYKGKFVRREKDGELHDTGFMRITLIKFYSYDIKSNPDEEKVCS